MWLGITEADLRVLVYIFLIFFPPWKYTDEIFSSGRGGRRPQDWQKMGNKVNVFGPQKPLDYVKEQSTLLD